MKKIIFCLFIFLFLPRILFSQVIAASYGQFHADFSTLNSQLISRGATKTFGSAFNAVGIFSAYQVNVNRRGSYDGGFLFEWILPEDISVGDSIKFHLHGWHLMTSLYGFRIVNKKNIAFTAGPGIDWGSVKIRENNNSNETKFYNPFISPLARAELRFMFGPIAIGSRISYHYDISKGQWKQNGNLAPLPGSKISGLGLHFFIGWTNSKE